MSTKYQEILEKNLAETEDKRLNILSAMNEIYVSPNLLDWQRKWVHEVCKKYQVQPSDYQ